MRPLFPVLLSWCLLTAASAEEPVYFADPNLKKVVELGLFVWDPTPTEMLGLTQLYGYPVGIVDLTGLEYATNLQILHLRGNRIRDLSPLSGLTNLEELHVNVNQISDLSPLSGLTNLCHLDAHNNQISDLSSLSDLTDLEILKLFNNQISDLSPLLGLGRLTRLDVRGNPLNEESYCAHLQMIDDNNSRVWVSYLPNHRPPASVTASDDAFPDRVRITWEAVCGGHYLSHYQVSRAPSAEGAKTPISGWQTSLSFDDVTAEPGTKYTYWVRTASLSPGAPAGDYSEPDVGWVSGQAALTISSGPGGAVTVPGEGVHAAEVGQTIRVEAQPVDANLYFFAGWTGTAVETGLVADANAAFTTVTVDSARSALKANFFSTMDAIYVDDDAPNDPGPNTAAISDPDENGTPEHPLDTIQEGIDVAVDGATVIVREGTYRECIEFCGRNITVTGFDPNEAHIPKPYPVIDADYAGTAVTVGRGEGPSCLLAGLIITRGRGDLGGAVRLGGSSPTIANCLIVGNRAANPNGAAVYCTGSDAMFVNCTIANNVGGEERAAFYLFDSNVALLNSILWGNTPSDIIGGGRRYGGTRPSMTYTYITYRAGGGAGPGSIDADPLFAEAGWWADPNDPSVAIGPNDPRAVWIDGDYHLQSQAGRWDPRTQAWVRDDATSLCLDAGDPTSPVGDEPVPHGGIINMGAYGGTPHASKSPGAP